MKGIGRWLHTGAAAALGRGGNGRARDTSILNVSYDVTRELYKDINAGLPLPASRRPARRSRSSSRTASSAQALSVLQGLQADVVTMNQPNDIDLLAERGQLLPKDWRALSPDNSSPYSTTMVFLVRRGNPKAIKDWSDLAKPGVQVIIANPKTSGNGRYARIWPRGLPEAEGRDRPAGDRLREGDLPAAPVLDSGGRGATTTFTQRGIGDVLVTFENEVALMDTGASGAQFDAVYPSASISRGAARRRRRQGRRQEEHARKVAQAYLDYLYAGSAGDHRATPSAPRATRTC